MPRAVRRIAAIKADRFTERQFVPYVRAIGQLVLAWNSLQDELARTYLILMTGEIPDDDDHDKTVAVMEGWFSVKSDRGQRELLRCAVCHATKRERRVFPRLVEDMTWLLNRVSSLEDDRNNAVHSPLVLLSAKRNLLMRYLGTPDRVIPTTISGNPRAARLAKKELLTEFKWCRQTALAYRDFAQQVNRSLRSVGYPWPQRPSLPNRGQKKIQPHDKRRAQKK